MNACTAFSRSRTNKVRFPVYYDHGVPTIGVVAGRVVSVAAHPAADRIRLAVVDIGLDHKVQIVFGGFDLVMAGDFVPVAPPGARLPGRRKMRRERFRGQWSHGMFCSATELGWSDDGPDEVALLRHQNLFPGLKLDDINWQDFLIHHDDEELKIRRTERKSN
jgi:tRNA-binding EMAP/Myf-like protein